RGITNIHPCHGEPPIESIEFYGKVRDIKVRLKSKDFTFTMAGWLSGPERTYRVYSKPLKSDSYNEYMQQICCGSFL
ncbi:MAG: hypothetical protein AABX71_00775, partial [Nanoarchaeota archaeon]